jgi:hypothetical protein
MFNYIIKPEILVLKGSSQKTDDLYRVPETMLPYDNNLAKMQIIVPDVTSSDPKCHHQL